MEIEKIDNLIKESNFEYLIDKDNYFDGKISEIVVDIFNTMGKLFAHKHHLSYFKTLNDFLKEADNDDYQSIDPEDIEWIKKRFDKFFQELNNELNIRNKDNYEDLLLILELSGLILEEALEQKKTEPLYESFFQMESRINELEIRKKEYEFRFILDEEYKKEYKINMEIENLPNNLNHDLFEEYAQDHMNKEKIAKNFPLVNKIKF